MLREGDSYWIDVNSCPLAGNLPPSLDEHISDYIIPLAPPERLPPGLPSAHPYSGHVGQTSLHVVRINTWLNVVRTINQGCVLYVPAPAVLSRWGPLPWDALILCSSLPWISRSNLLDRVENLPSDPMKVFLNNRLNWVFDDDDPTQDTGCLQARWAIRVLIQNGDPN